MKIIAIMTLLVYVCNKATAERGAEGYVPGWDDRTTEEDFHHWRTTPPTTPCPTVTTTRCPAVQQVSEQMDKFFGQLDGGDKQNAGELGKFSTQLDELVKLVKFWYCRRPGTHKVEDLPPSKPGQSMWDWYTEHCCSRCNSPHQWCGCGGNKYEATTKVIDQ